MAELFAAFGALSSDEALQGESQGDPGSADARASSAALRDRPERHRVRVSGLLFPRLRRTVLADVYDSLMVETDSSGVARGYLANEASFAIVKDIESRNLIVPVVGDFAGPKTLRAIGTYLKDHSAIVSAFYLSNVEQYLYAQGKWMAFCRNVSTLPLESSSLFIRASAGRGLGFGVGFVTTLRQHLE